MPQRSVSKSIPAATGGWNARDLTDAMSQTDALRLENIFPSTGSVDVRRGFRAHQSGAGSGPVRGLFSLNGIDGTNKMLAAANLNLYDVTTYGGTPSSKTSGLTITNNDWQGINFKGGSTNGVLVIVNGADGPHHYDGSTVTDKSADYTGPTVADLVQVDSYRRRLYFVPKDSTSIWYGGVNQRTGTLTEFDVGSLLTEGGYVLFASSWSHDSGAGLEDFLVIMSSEGEGLVYSGDYPHASNWSIAKHFYVGKPLNRRAYTRKEGDLIITTANGVLPLSEVFSPTGADRSIRYFTDKVQNAFNSDYRDYSSNTGWDALYYKKGNYLIFNVPLVTDSISEQYVMNTLTGSWCKFTNQNAGSWCVHDDKLYFGGMNGVVYQADYGYNDGGSAINVKYKQAFNYFGDRNTVKHFNLGRPRVTANADIEFVFDVDVDGGDETITGTASSSTTLTLWGDVGASTPLWGATGAAAPDWEGSSSALSSNWYSLTGVGRSAAPKLRGEFTDVNFSISSFDFNYVTGGVI